MTTLTIQAVEPKAGGADVLRPSGTIGEVTGAVIGLEEKTTAVSGNALMEAIELTTAGMLYLCIVHGCTKNYTVLVLKARHLHVYKWLCLLQM